MPSQAIVLEGVCIERGGRLIQRQIDWTIPGPGLYALTGPSGCGKTSVFMAIAGLLTPQSGVIRKPISSPGSVGVIWQELHLILRDSVLNNTASGALHRLRWWQSWLRFPADVRHQAQSELETLGIGHLARRWARDISGGERARCAVARAMVHAPPLILADEPVAALDAETAVMVMQRLRAHADAGHIVLCALHQPELVQRFADAELALTAS